MSGNVKKRLTQAVPAEIAARTALMATDERKTAGRKLREKVPRVVACDDGVRDERALDG
jgi:hypothetical protein